MSSAADIKPLEIHRAERLAHRARQHVAKASALAWALDTNLRNYRRAVTPQQAAEAASAVAKASAEADKFLVHVEEAENNSFIDGVLA